MLMKLSFSLGNGGHRLVADSGWSLLEYYNNIVPVRGSNLYLQLFHCTREMDSADILLQVYARHIRYAGTKPSSTQGRAWRTVVAWEGSWKG